MTAAPAPVAGLRMAPVISYAHLLRLTDDVGLFEHAELTRPRPEHGYCVDDVARGLLVVARATTRTPRTPALDAAARTYLDFVTAAVDDEGRAHNRRAFRGGWTDRPGVEDCWGRALWGLGTAVARMPDLADEALAAFDRAAAQRSPDLRAMAFAAMGAAEVLDALPRHALARALLGDAARLVDTRVMPATVESPSPRASVRWPWPEPRLRYANGVLPETLLAAGSGLGNDTWTRRGLDRLTWLADVETVPATDGSDDTPHLSVTPVDGWGLGEPRPGFDQQPIEVAALADAAARASDVTGEPRWDDLILRCEAWFLGHNDVGIALLDADGGGFDGLERTGRNENEGAESTIALLTTLQQADRVRVRAA